ncbi:D-lactaldehyde dehydrogenase [Crucibulum laeve]|uniref:D-lactaldehyde dehydrogenase n=1 Tax=Crucibulum laeve TaxID=68775 RepID=A0A5C3M0D3_9AGAR|nr:D-lactaldehyde dehydrogenase [Crucibulum laeve]
MSSVLVSPHSKVLVTGANGFIAMWIISSLLEQGYSVRGTVRTKDKSTLLEEHFASYAEKFEVVVVPDITKEGAFDQHVQDVEAIVHTASPLAPPTMDPDAFIRPAVDGTLSILNSIRVFGKHIKRIVHTSSTGAIARIFPKPRKLTEEDWNEMSAASVEAKVAKINMKRQNGENVEEKDKPTEMEMYWASKTLAERAAWDFYNKHKAELGWDLVVLNPALVFGPPLYNSTSPSDLNDSLDWFYRSVVAPSQGASPETSLTPEEDKAALPKEASEAYATHMRQTASYVDVRDLAQAHVLALQREDAGGERIIVCAGRGTWQDWVDAANAVFPPPTSPVSHPLPKGVPGVQGIFLMQYDASKADRVLGMKYRTREETVRDTLLDFGRRGW